MDIQTFLSLTIAAMAFFTLIATLLAPRLAREAAVARRQKTFIATERLKVAGARANEMSRREQVARSLKDLDAKQQQTRRPPLRIQLQQAGMSISVPAFVVLACLIGLSLAGLMHIVAGNIWVTLASLVVGTLGLPRLLISFRRKRRVAAFINEFPNALDVITRGIKAGLPLGDCVRIIAQEAVEPVKGEFRSVSEAQTLGISLGDAVNALNERMPCAEASFFAIVISIQQKAGGNLSEALTNLSRVLRERKKMRAKIKAVSTEAKVSAIIIGMLPIVVMGMVYVMTPSYISQLWTTSTGHVMLGISAVLMAIGIVIMRKMIDFDI